MLINATHWSEMLTSPATICALFLLALFFVGELTTFFCTTVPKRALGLAAIQSPGHSGSSRKWLGHAPGGCSGDGRSLRRPGRVNIMGHRRTGAARGARGA